MKPTVFLIENNPETRNAAAAIFAAREIPCETFDSAEEFLYRLDPLWTGCVVSEAILPNISGLELVRAVVNRGVCLPVILGAGGADVRMAVEAMRWGAMTFLEKPYAVGELTEAVYAAFRMSQQMRAVQEGRAEVKLRWGRLSPRERQLAELVVDGKTNKYISRILGACERTVERLRSKVFEAMDVDSAPQLAKVLADLERTEDEFHVPPSRIYQAMAAHATPLRPLAWPLQPLSEQPSASSEQMS